MIYQTKQRSKRSAYKETVEITTPSHPQHRTLVAIGSNISDVGVCIYTFKPLEEGDEIIFNDDLPVPHRRARIIWVKQCNQSIYKAGAEFIE
jgi:hypothetical protein